MPPPSQPTEPQPPFQPVAAVLAWIFPGLGHWYLGHTRRAVLIAAGILGLLGSGLLIGGIDCIDRKEDYFWFLGQALTGPVVIGLDHLHQTQFKGLDPTSVTNLRRNDPALARGDFARAVRRSARPNEIRIIEEVKLGDGSVLRVPTFTPARAGEFPPNIKGLGRTNELGTLFCTIAGFMNLICICDAAQNRRRDNRASAPARKAVTA